MGVTTRLLLLATITGVKSYLLNNSHAKVAFSCMVLCTPIAASLAVDTSLTTIERALLTPSRQGALEVVAVRLGAATRNI